MTDSLARTLAKRFVERASALGLKGVKRDNAALDYFCGAASALEEIGDPRAASIATTAALIVAVRGYMGVAEIAYREEAEAPANARRSI